LCSFITTTPETRPRTHLIRGGVLAHRLTDEQRRRGGLTRQAQLRSEREERRRRLEAVLDARLEALADALIVKALEGDVGALREAIHQLVGRPIEGFPVEAVCCLSDRGSGAATSVG
jgi:hypothetical protein